MYSEQKFEYVKRQHDTELKLHDPHPAGRSYLCNTYPLQVTEDGCHWYGSDQHRDKDFSMFNLVRNISNSSLQLRCELGDMFWDRTYIHGGDWSGWRFDQVAKLLLMRPAILKEVKSLKFELDVLNRTAEGIAAFVRDFEVFTPGLSLEVLSIDFTVKSLGFQLCLPTIRMCHGCI